MNDSLKKIITIMSSPKLVFYTIPWMMIILIFGTLAQRYIGLYDAQKMFFSSFFIWVWFIPIPGGYLTTGIILISLLIKLVFKSKYKFDHLGIIVTHIGVLLLLFGGLFTAFASQEGYITLFENQQSNIVSNYHDRELVIIKNKEELYRISFDGIAEEKPLNINKLPFKINILEKCRNCEIVSARFVNNLMRQDAALIKLLPKQSAQEDEENISGVTFSISDTTENIEGIYVLFENSRNNVFLKHNKDEFQIIIRKAQSLLPFKIHLTKFKKVLYPGTEVAKSYSSSVVIKDNGIEWPVLIQMNEPLRYKGYTFYQSAFINNQGDNISVLAVVKNIGAIFPYIACIIMSIGILMHILIKFSKVRENKHV